MEVITESGVQGVPEAGGMDYRARLAPPSNCPTALTAPYGLVRETWAVPNEQVLDTRP